MAYTYEAIATVSVGAGGTTTVTFSNIPQTYTDLVLKYSSRTDDASVIDGINIRANNNTAASNFTRMAWEGGAVGGGYVSPSSRFLYQNGANSTANSFNNSEAYYVNYTSVNNKQQSGDGYTPNNGSNASIQVAAASLNSADPLTSIVIDNGGTKLILQHSIFTLFGIKRA